MTEPEHTYSSALSAIADEERLEVARIEMMPPPFYRYRFTVNGRLFEVYDRDDGQTEVMELREVSPHQRLGRVVAAPEGGWTPANIATAFA